MDAMFGGGGFGGGGAGGGGGFGQVPIEQWFFDMPPITRWWTTAIVACGVAVQCGFLSPFQLFYDYQAAIVKGQYWRLVTTFIYFGPIGIQLIWHVFFIQRYARMLEEASPSIAHFSWTIAYAAISLICLSPLFDQPFLGGTLSSTLTYVWSRKNPDIMLSFLGLFNFKAPWLPFVMIGLSVVMHEHWPLDELFGIAVGHVWYFFNDIYPQTHNNQRPLDPPRWWVTMIQGVPFDGTQQEIQPPRAIPGIDDGVAAAPEVR